MRRRASRSWWEGAVPRCRPSGWRSFANSFVPAGESLLFFDARGRRLCQGTVAPSSALAGPEGFGHVVAGLGQAGAFELHRGGVNAKNAFQARAYLGQNFFAFLHVHIGNANVAGKSVIAGSQRPDVDIVHF